MDERHVSGQTYGRVYLYDMQHSLILTDYCWPLIRADLICGICSEVRFVSVEARCLH